jgi:hypothetical protein
MPVGSPMCRSALCRLVSALPLPALIAVAPIAAGQLPNSSRLDGGEIARASALTGVVKDSIGDPIAYAAVYVDGNRGTIANESGRFALSDVTPGKTTFGVRRLGYLPLNFTMTMPTDTTVAVSIRLHRAVQNMREVTVEEKMLSMSLYRAGFYDRARAGTGYFIQPAEIRDRAPARIEELLYGVPGVTVMNRNGALAAFGLTPAGYCRLSIFLDGQRYQMHESGEVLIQARDLDAVEIYPRPTEAPAQFHDPDNSLCGVIVLWTKVD